MFSCPVCSLPKDSDDSADILGMYLLRDYPVWGESVNTVLEQMQKSDWLCSYVCCLDWPYQE